MALYRRKWGTPVWHWFPGCSHWPKSDIEAEERDTRPTRGQFCNECQCKSPEGDASPKS